MPSASAKNENAALHTAPLTVLAATMRLGVCPRGHLPLSSVVQVLRLFMASSTGAAWQPKILKVQKLIAVHATCAARKPHGEHTGLQADSPLTSRATHSDVSACRSCHEPLQMPSFRLGVACWRDTFMNSPPICCRSHECRTQPSSGPSRSTVTQVRRQRSMHKQIQGSSCRFDQRLTSYMLLFTSVKCAKQLRFVRITNLFCFKRTRNTAASCTRSKAGCGEVSAHVPWDGWHSCREG